MVPAFLMKNHPFKQETVEIGRRVGFSVVKVGIYSNKKEIIEGLYISMHVPLQAGPAYPTLYWYGTEAVYTIYVDSPELLAISRSLAGRDYTPAYGGPRNLFNIVVGIRSIKTRNRLLNLS